MKTLSDFRVQPGDPISARLLNELLDYLIQTRQFQSGSGVRLMQSSSGTQVVSDQPRGLFTGAFAVRVSSDKAIVSTGRVADITPTINGVRIDGTGDNGKAVDVPQLKLGKPGEDKRSYIVIRIEVDDKGKIPEDDPEAVRIEHISSLADRDASPLVGVHPIAQLQWSEDSKAPARVRQIVYFDQQHTFIAASGEKPARHLFWPAS